MTNTALAARVEALTGPQKAMLLQLSRGQPGFALIRQGLAFVNQLGARHLTDEGHAVAACLRAKGDAPTS